MIILLVSVIVAGCVTPSMEAECIRLLRCEVAWQDRDLNLLVLERCDEPKGFSMSPEMKDLAGVNSLDCAWSRPAHDLESEDYPL